MGGLAGIDIGMTRVKAVQLARQGESVNFVASSVADISGKGIQSESTLDQEELADTLRIMLNDARINSKSCAAAIPDNHVYSKVVDMPLLNEKELPSAIFWEAEQYIPVALDTISLDWKILHRDFSNIKSPRMLVLLIGAPLSLIHKYLNVFDYAGISLDSVETETLAIIRAACLGDYSTALIVNISSLYSSFAIIKQGIPVFLYTLPIGGLAVNRAISTDMNLSLEQAEEYKKAYGIENSGIGLKIKTAVDPILSSMMLEIKKAISFFNVKNNSEGLINQIVITGGTANLRGITTYFVEGMNIETSVLNPWRSLSVKNVPDKLITDAAEYSIALGLAAKGL